MKEVLPSKKKIVLIVAAALALLVAGWMVFSAVRTYPLGDRIEYMKSYTGGSYFPLSISKPYTDYYYTTDMNPHEIVAYFKKAVLLDSPPHKMTGNYKLETENSKIVELRISENLRYNYKQFEQSSKKYVLVISDKDYDSLKQSLE
jgi:hypothetical protein